MQEIHLIKQLPIRSDDKNNIKATLHNELIVCKVFTGLTNWRETHIHAHIHEYNWRCFVRLDVFHTADGFYKKYLFHVGNTLWDLVVPLSVIIIIHLAATHLLLNAKIQYIVYMYID